MKITHERLCKLLHYDPETGTWTRNITRGRCDRWKAGEAVGTLKYDGRPGSGPRRQICIDDRYYRSSRLAFFYMTGKWPKHKINHIDLDALNDQWNNLREATQSQIEANKRVRKDNALGVKGVRRKRKKVSDANKGARNRNISWCFSDKTRSAI